MTKVCTTILTDTTCSYSGEVFDIFYVFVFSVILFFLWLFIKSLVSRLF